MAENVQKKTLVVLRILLAYAVIPNAIYLVASRSVQGTSKGVIGLEFLLAAAVAVGFSRKLGAALGAMGLILEGASIVAAMYYFTWSEVIASLRSIRYVPIWRIVGYAGTVIAIAVVFAVVLYVLTPAMPTRVGRAAATVILVSVLVLGGTDFALGHHGAFGGDDVAKPRGTHLSRSFIMTLGLRGVWMWSWNRAPLDLSEAPSATNLVTAMRNSNPPNARPPHVVQIVAESLGAPNVPGVLPFLESRYSSKPIRERYVVYTGTVPFFGATVDAEIREMCGDRLGLGVVKVSASQLTGCLPTQLHNEGYQTIGVHGFAGAMFDRRSWYSKMGFDEVFFRRELQSAGAPNCPGAFEGSCDSAVASWIGERLKNADRPTLVHWVTLGAHLPLSTESGTTLHADCGQFAAVASSDAFCTWFKLQDKLQESVADLAMRQDIGPVIFIIVGDHAPPFTNASLRNEFSQTRVPYIILIPRSTGAISPQQPQIRRSRTSTSSDSSPQTGA